MVSEFQPSLPGLTVSALNTCAIIPLLAKGGNGDYPVRVLQSVDKNQSPHCTNVHKSDVSSTFYNVPDSAIVRNHGHTTHTHSLSSRRTTTTELPDILELPSPEHQNCTV